MIGKNVNSLFFCLRKARCQMEIVVVMMRNFRCSAIYNVCAAINVAFMNCNETSLDPKMKQKIAHTALN